MFITCAANESRPRTIRAEGKATEHAVQRSVQQPRIIAQLMAGDCLRFAEMSPSNVCYRRLCRMAAVGREPSIGIVSDLSELDPLLPLSLALPMGAMPAIPDMVIGAAWDSDRPKTRRRTW